MKSEAVSHTEQACWKDLLAEERQSDYFKNILKFIENERSTGKIIYPGNSDIFAALKHTEFHNVKVVIIGQDPYHGPNQAHGLCFSVKPGVASPPSLQNIFKELKADLNLPIPNHGCLLSWTTQGVLLLNSVLSVEAGKPGSHASIGWQKFTDKTISILSEQREKLVFLLWGAYAQQKAELIDASKHYILKAAHPSPFSAHRGFLGCKHFSKSNELLKANGYTEIDWKL